MISFNLVCSKGHEFGGWFANSAGFEKQAKKKQIACPTCGDTAVSKAVMAPKVAAKSAVKQARAEKVAKMREMLTELRDHVEHNFDDVGDDFPEEARRIYYGETDARDIYGNATDEEAEEMLEEGLPVGRLPWIKRPNG
jgi:hypothetical protein